MLCYTDITKINFSVVSLRNDPIRPSLKGGLCMSAGQKNHDVVVVVVLVVVVVVSKFEIRDVWLIQPCSRDRQSRK